MNAKKQLLTSVLCASLILASFAGCSGMAEAMVAGEVATASACKPSKPDARTKIVEYLTTTPGPDGNTINIKA